MIHLPPHTSAIQLTVRNSAQPDCPPVRFPGEIKFTLERKGCNRGCDIDNFLITEGWPNITVRLAHCATDIARGYYSGYLTIGCEETCRMNFFVGQNLCFNAAPECGDNLIGGKTCEVCEPCRDGKVIQRTYRIIEASNQGVTLLADDQCIEIPECEVCPECHD